MSSDVRKQRATEAHALRALRLKIEALNRLGFRVLKVEDVGEIEGVQVVAVVNEIHPEDCDAAAD